MDFKNIDNYEIKIKNINNITRTVLFPYIDNNIIENITDFNIKKNIIKKTIVNNYGIKKYMDELSLLSDYDREKILYFFNITILEYCFVQIFYNENFINHQKRELNLQEKLIVIIEIIINKLNIDYYCNDKKNIINLFSIFNNIYKSIILI